MKDAHGRKRKRRLAMTITIMAKTITCKTTKAKKVYPEAIDIPV